jgi:hypothetical protein
MVFSNLFQGETGKGITEKVAGYLELKAWVGGH